MSIEATLLPGAHALLEAHARALPQRDDLCGAFCGALALSAAGLEHDDGEPLDQDAVALAAGSVVSGEREPGTLPHGEPGRRDYRLAIPTIEDSAVSGTTAAGVARAIEQLSDGRLAAIPYAGPWNTATLAGLFDLAAGLPRPLTLVANLATHHLWGSRASLAQLFDHLVAGTPQGPPPDWHVGHFACVVGCAQGPGGRLYALADTYPALGSRGVHMQPQERLAAAIDRRDMPAGGVLVAAFAEDATAVRAGASEIGLSEAMWDNGTVTSGSSA